MLRWLIVCIFMGLMLTPTQAGILTGSTGSHDPSRMISCNGKYYIYSTGGGMKSSTDRINWISGTSPFAGFSDSRPPTMKVAIPTDQGIWAPDIIFYNNKYYLYYSCAASDGLSCAIGLITSPTLDSTVSGYGWTDVGVVIKTNDKVEKKSGIDPAPFIDTGGDLWLAWGSGYANGSSWSDPTFFISKLNNATGMRSATDTNYYPVALGHIEAAYIHYHAGFYYAFWNDGGCCSGASSTYKVHVARSPTVTGPYVDKNGNTNASATFLASTVTLNTVNGAQHGPGHIGILSEDGVDRFTYHYYPSTGGSVIGEQTLLWGADGWPIAGRDIPPGTYKITSDANGLALTVRGAVATDGTPIVVQTYASSAYQLWTVSLTYSSGTTADGYYSVTSVGSGKVIDLYQAAMADGTLIDQGTTGTGNNQRWFIEQTSDGRYRIISRSSSDAISIPTSSQTPKPQMALINNGADAQISFLSQIGWNYSVLSSPDLKSWTMLTTLPGAGGAQTYTQSGGGNGPNRFWRMIIQQAINAWTWSNLSTQKWNFAAPRFPGL